MNRLRIVLLAGIAVAAAAPDSGPTPAWIYQPNQYNARLGDAVASAGDINLDGYGDLLVGHSFFSNAKSQAGRALLFLGGPAGLASTPAWTAEGDQAYEHLGAVLSAAGDLNGDGWPDVAIGAPDYAAAGPSLPPAGPEGPEPFQVPQGPLSGAGAVMVYLGSPAGLSTTPTVIAGSESGANFGGSIGVGDFNQDGRGDLVIGARNGNSTKGAAYVFSGGDGGFPAIPSWTMVGDVPYAYLGHSVANAGDVNEDGCDDVIVAKMGRVMVYYGHPGTGPGATPDWSTDGDPVTDIIPMVAGAGDVNGDGVSDILIGGYNFYQGPAMPGKCYLFFGHPGGPSVHSDWTMVGPADNDYFGCSVSSAGDINGDGYGDVVIGAECYGENPSVRTGAAFVLAGGSAGLSPAYWTLYGSPDSRFGCVVNLAGDVNGDGCLDFAVGAPYTADPESYEGAVYVYHGQNLPPNAPSSLAQFTLDGSTTIPAGGVTFADGFIARGVVTDPEGSTTALEVEVKPVGVAFDGLGTLPSSPQSPSGSTVSVVINGLTLWTPIHWRARCVDAHGQKSPWQSFGTHPDLPSEVDLLPRSNVAPGAPALVQQDASVDGPLAVGGSAFSTPGLRLSSTVQDADGDPVRLEVEVRPVGIEFSGTANVFGDVTAPGGVSSATVALDPGRYHWRGRLVDSVNAPTAWAAFGGNDEGAADFEVIPAGSQGPAACTHSATGSMALAALVAALALIGARRPASFLANV